MATDIRIITGYVEEPKIRPRGGRAATRASNIKLQSSERLSDLVGGTAVGRGVENTDTLKAGNLTPEARVAARMETAKGLHARIQRAKADPDMTPLKRGLLVAKLEDRLAEVLAEVDSIQRDLLAKDDDENLN
jgi:hypothetical protein